MRWIWVAALIAAVAGHARADPVNLLTSAPGEVAVSSTVANAKLPPGALVDGDLETAWNSRTGEATPWIAARVPISAHITAIKMTVGFTHVEAGQDWFTMNQRIKRVKVLRNGTVLAEHTFDVDARGLQTIALDVPGGDLTVSISELLPGSKPSWREVCVSEFQVWGTLAGGTTAVPSKPAVRIGGFSSPTPATAEPTSPQVTVSTIPRVLLVLTAANGTATIALGAPPRTFTPGGSLALFDPPRASGGDHDAVVLQPIAEPATVAPWIGRQLTLYDASAEPCDAWVTGLGIVASGYVDTRDLPPTPGALIALAWKNRRSDHQLLVAVVRSAHACTGALWAQPRGTPIPLLGTIEKRRYRKLLQDAFLDDPDGGYERLSLHYQLDDLNGEYQDTAINEAKIPVDERLTRDLVRKTMDTFAACGPKGHCVGLAAGHYRAHELEETFAIDDGKLTRIGGGTCSSSVGEPLAAVDLDGDGRVEVLYATDDGIAFSGTTLNGAAETRQPPCPYLAVP